MNRPMMCCFAAAALMSYAAGPVAAADMKLRFGHVLTADVPAAKAAEMMAANVKKRTNGAIEITVLPAGQLGDDTAIVEQIQFGSAHLGTPPTAKLGNFEPRMQVFDLPYIFPDEAAVAKVLDGDIGKELLATLEKQGLKGLCYWASGYKQITSKKKAILSPADLAGIKMRTMDSPLIVQQYRTWGANPIPIAFGETYNALQQGVADAQENSLVSIDKMKFYEVQDHLTLSRHAYLPYAIILNLASWKRMTPDQQKIMMEECAQARDWVRAELTRQDAEIAKRMAGTLKVHQLSPKSHAEFVDLSRKVHQNFEKVVSRALLDRIYAATKRN